MLRILLALYYPFIVGIVIFLVGVIAGLAYLRILFSFGVVPGCMIIFLALGTLCHVLYACRVLFWPHKDLKNPLELKLPRKNHGIIYAWVDEIAEVNDLIAPDEIRLGADALAHVYESAKGKNVLVLGGMAVGTFTKSALGGIVAHELAHFTHGDTALARSASRRVTLMNALEQEVNNERVGLFNPTVWLILAYHRFFALAYAQYSREQEYAADEWEVAHAGKEIAAATLIHLHVTNRMPWVRLSSVVETAIAMGQPVQKDVFAEQARRAKSAPPDEWERMLKKELDEPTKSFDSHPALSDRLDAIGVSPKKALALALSVEGEPATKLFPAWSSIQQDLSERLTYQPVDLFRSDLPSRAYSR